MRLDLAFPHVLILLASVASGCALLLHPGADQPLAPVVEDTIVSTRQRTVATRARRIHDVPDLSDPGRIRAGAGNYDAMCAICHLAPGREPEELQRGLQPPPPDLAKGPAGDPRETFWVIKHGIKLTAMPAWGQTIPDEDLWSLTAFVQHLPSLTADEYAGLVEESGGHHHGSVDDEHEHTREHDHDEEEQHEHEDQHDGEHAMAHAPMTLLERVEMRNASGTAWQPESTPMSAFHAETGPVRWMAHGNVFVLYDVQGSERGDSQLTSTNWIMGHAMLSDEDSEIGVRAMLSAEPFTVGGAGYPLLGQTGETWEGQPLVDHQHPHDLFMELALVGRQTFRDAAGIELYAAPAGEPALGPAAFPHRASAISDPLAPLGHHWQDATHISFGVLTAGVFNEWAKLEGSWFNGREPDEDRYGLDLAALDSFSGRLTVSLLPAWTLQVSGGRLAEPEALEPGPVTRITASTTFDHDGRGDGNWATTLVWGRNVREDEGSDAFLIETDAGVGHNNVFGRAEYVTKSAEELVVPSEPPDREFGLTSLSIGDVFGIRADGLRIGLGVRGNLLVVPRDLEPTYGGPVAVGGVAFVQVRPAEASMHGGE